MSDAIPPGRAVLAVVFTDLVASTELRATVGDVAADEITHAHERVLRDAFGEHGGIHVKSLGDGMMVVFRACSDALAATVVAQRAIWRLNQSRTTKIAVRIGVSVGEVSVVASPAFDVHGTPAVEAARLCATAQGAQTLAAVAVRAMAGSRSGVTTHARGPLALKGLAAPLDTEEIDWVESAGVAPVPLQPLVDSARGAFVVGQTEERAVLDRAWTEVRGGERRAVLISGDPGAGKTTLASRWAAAAHAQGAIVLGGRCTEDLGVAHEPFVEAIRHHVTSTVGSTLVDALGHHAGTLARLVPELGVDPPPAGATAEQEQHDLHLAVAAWLRVAASDHPLVLILDDLHWATAPTCALLRALLRDSVRETWMILGTYRASDLDDGHPLATALADLRRATGIERIDMSPLSADDVADLVATITPGARTGTTSAARVAHDVNARCAGNPFFVTQLLRHLVDEGDLHADRGELALRRPVDVAGVPDSAAEVVERRLGRLTGEHRSVLAAASVVGAEFDVSLVGDLVDGGITTVLDSLDAAERLHLVTPIRDGTRYRYAHALVADTVYSGLPAGQRARLHHRVGTALGRRPGNDAATVAHHLVRGLVAGDPLDVAAACIRAGDEAMQRVAPADAVTWYDRARELQESAGADGASLIDTLVLLGTAQRNAGSKASRPTLLRAADLALRADDADRLAAAALANFHGGYSMYGVVDHDRVRVLRAALDRQPAVDSPVRAQLLGVLAVEMLFEDDAGERFALAEEALAMARRLGDPQTMLDVISHYWHSASSVDDATLWDRLGEEAITHARRIGTPLAMVTALGYVRGAAHRHGDFARMQWCLDEARAVEDRLGPYVMSGWPATVRVMLPIFRGDLAEAEQNVIDVLRMRVVMPNTKLYALMQLTEIRRWQGRFHEVADDTIRAAIGASVRGDVCLSAGRLDLAEEAWQEASRSTLEQELRTAPSPAGALALRTPLAARFGTDDDVRETLARWEGLGDVFLHPLLPRPIGWHYTGLLHARLGDDDAADADFARAVAREDELGFPLLAADTRLEWAAALDGRGERAQDVQRLVAEAIEIAEPLGAALITQRADLIEERVR